MYSNIKYTSLSWLKKNEQHAIDETFAMIAYNPSIGRVLKPGGVKDFKKVAIKKIKGLKNIKNQKEFNDFHDRFVRSVMNKIKFTSMRNKISYGQGQKAVNVFLKLYVDWASYPNKTIASRVKKFLHVPLDSWVMWYIKNERCKDFDKIVKPIYKKIKMNRCNLSLAQIDKNIYYAWQELCKNICPKKPVLLDVIWARARR